MSKLPGPLKLARAAWTDLWRWKRPLAGVVAVVALPAALLSAFSLDVDPMVSSYVAFATLFMNAALLWSVMRLQQGKPVGVKKAYYEGTALTVRFILLTVIYLLMVVPFLLGLTLYLNAIGGEGAVQGLAENLLVAGVWLLLAWPSLYWLTRSIFGLLDLHAGNGPVEAIRLSGEAVHGRTGAVFGRLVGLVAVMMVGITLPTFVVISSAGDDLLPVALAIIQTVGTFVVLPFAYLYLYHLYQALRKEAA